MTFTATKPIGTKPQIYAELARQARGLFEGERDAIANAAGLSALIFLGLPDINWVGFYFLKQGELVLGPFQGKPACVRIALGKGVCGAAARNRKTLLVPDVDRFPGHIVCDPDSRSEVVVPLIRNGNLIGVLDCDAPVRGRFDEDDRAGFEQLAQIWLKASDPL